MASETRKKKKKFEKKETAKFRNISESVIEKYVNCGPMPASMPTSNSPYPTALLALLIDATNDQKSINNNCNGAVHESTAHINTNQLSYRQPNESNGALRAGEKTRRAKNKMNLQVVCITVTLVICCIVITGLEVSKRAVSSSYYKHRN